MSDEIKDQIEETALGPKRVRGDEGEVEAMPIAEQILADRYLASKTATGKAHFGLRFRKIIPPSAD
ncbi:MAG TPA: hypothetical protein VMW15_14730 [Terracidiphilus sp.]|nr:hypothetical protein [Terracidiphilus sp.]